MIKVSLKNTYEVINENCIYYNTWDTSLGCLEFGLKFDDKYKLKSYWISLKIELSA